MVEDPAEPDSDWWHVGQEVGCDLSHALHLLVGELVGWACDVGGHVQPFGWCHVQAGERGEAVACLAGEFADLRVVAHKDVPVQGALNLGGIGSSCPPVGHLLGQGIRPPWRERVARRGEAADLVPERESERAGRMAADPQLLVEVVKPSGDGGDPHVGRHGEHGSDVLGRPVEVALLEMGDGCPDSYLGPGPRYLRFARSPALIGGPGCP